MGDLPTSLDVALIGAAATLLVAALRAVVDWRKATQDRVRGTYMDALAAVTEYAEFVYVIRRRSTEEEQGAERARISEALRGVQQRLNYHRAWIRTRDRQVSHDYNALVEQVKEVMGGQMRDAWAREGAASDTEMNIDDVDYDDIDDYINRYLRSVTDSLSLLPAWVYRTVRRATGGRLSRWSGPTPAHLRPAADTP